MKSLRRLLRLSGRVRYWRKRCLVAESRELDLRQSLEAERYRNMEREDSFVSASIMGQRQMWGVPARSGPALQQHQLSNPAPVPTPIYASAWDAHLGWADRQEWLIWKQDADAAGIDERKARQDFLDMMSHRRQLNDDPLNH